MCALAGSRPLVVPASRTAVSGCVRRPRCPVFCGCPAERPLWRRLWLWNPWLVAAVSRSARCLCGAGQDGHAAGVLFDAHPSLAWPPETSVAALCGQPASVWALLEGAPCW